MHAKKPFYAPFAAFAAALVLTACGGGAGGNDPVVLSSHAGVSADKDLTIKAGEAFSFTVVADSPDNVISKLNWTMQASADAPALAVSNLDCAVAEKTDTPRQNGLVASVWKCTINGVTPGLVEKDAVYTFTANATNSKSSTGSTSSVLKVTATPADALIPKVEVEAPTKVAGGTVQDLSCNASNRLDVDQSAIYTYAWSSSAFEGQQVTFDNRFSKKVKATFPKMSADTTMIVTCKATDSSGNIGQGSATVEVTQAAPEVTISGTTSGTSGSSIALTCSAAGGGSSSYKYSWSSLPVNGASLTFDATDRSLVSVTLPNVTKPTSIIATCEVTDEFGVKGQAAKAVDVSPGA